LADLANIAERMAIEVLVEEVKLIATLDDTTTEPGVRSCNPPRACSHRGEMLYYKT